MLKQYKILVNEGKGSENVLVTVPAGAGERGNPTRITAKPDTRYELQDDLKGKGLGPDQVRGKRVGKNLYLMFEDNGKPDVIIEGYYDPVNLQQVPTIVGKAENGSVYEYIPHDPELSSMSTTLKDGYTPAMLSLGGGPIAGGAFELAGLPLVAAAAGGGLGGLGWIAAGLGAAALGGGGGGGGGAGGTPADTTAPSKPTSIVIPENANGSVNKGEAGDGTTLEVGLPADAVVGDVVKTVVTKPDKSTYTITSKPLTSADITAKKIIQTIPQAELLDPKKTDGSYLDGDWTTVTTVTDAAGNVGAPINSGFTLDTIVTATGHLVNDITNDTGSSSQDNITSNQTPKITGITEKGATVVVTVDGQVLKTITADAVTGEYTTENILTALKDGTYTPIITVTDLAGNTAAIDGKSFTVDHSVQNNPANNKLDPNAATDVTIAIADIAEDTGTKGDFITSKNILNISGTVSKFDTKINSGGEGDVLYVKLLDSKLSKVTDGYVTVDSNATWTLKNVSLPYGVYTIVAEIQDAAGNIVKQADHSLVVSTGKAAGDLKANDDTNSITAVTSSNATVSVTGNVVTGDSQTGKGADTDVLYQATELQISKSQSGTNFSTLSVFNTSIVGKYGTLTFAPDGTYTYVLNYADAAKLKGGENQPDDFIYEVAEKNGNLKSQAKLSITVTGAEESTTILVGNSSASLVTAKNTFGPAVPDPKNTLDSPINIKVSDLDYGDSFFMYLDKTKIDNPDVQKNFQGAYSVGGNSIGDFYIKLSGSQPLYSEHNYSWGYVYKLEAPAGSNVVHDLVTVRSFSDVQTQYVTLEMEINPVNAGTGHDYYSATATGLTASGHSSGVVDTLILTGSSLVLDLTATAITHVTEMERIDLTGSGNNIIKIDFAALTGMHSNQNQLFIIGDGGDKVQLVGTGWSLDNSLPHAVGYNVYTNASNNAYKLMIDTDITFV